MTRSQREFLVENYMTSGMSVDQEKEFFMRVATDGELFQTLRSYRMVERALYKDRETIPDGSSAVQHRALAFLVATGDSFSSPSRGLSLRGGTSRWAAGLSKGSLWAVFVSASLASAAAGYVTHAAFTSPTQRQQIVHAAPTVAPGSIEQGVLDYQPLQLQEVPASTRPNPAGDLNRRDAADESSAPARIRHASSDHSRMKRSDSQSPISTAPVVSNQSTTTPAATLQSGAEASQPPIRENGGRFQIIVPKTRPTINNK